MWIGKNDQNVFRCETCELTYLFPILSTEDKEIFYKKDFQEFMASRSPDGDKSGWLDAEGHILESEWQRLRRMRYLEPLLPEKHGSILDIGCSSGFMLYPLAERGYECVGIEPTRNFADYLRSRGLDCFESVDALKDDPRGIQGFDIIMHFFVADQTTNTFDFIAEQIPLLNKGGKIIFEINSTDDALISLYELESFDKFCWAIAQNFFFSYKSLRVLMEKFKMPYEILRDQRYDLSNHMVWARDGKPGGMGRFSDVLTPELNQLYRQTLIDAGRCDTLIGVLSAPE